VSLTRKQRIFPHSFLNTRTTRLQFRRVRCFFPLHKSWGLFCFTSWGFVSLHKLGFVSFASQAGGFFFSTTWGFVFVTNYKLGVCFLQTGVCFSPRDRVDYACSSFILASLDIALLLSLAFILCGWSHTCTCLICFFSLPICLSVCLSIRPSVRSRRRAVVRRKHCPTHARASNELFNDPDHAHAAAFSVSRASVCCVCCAASARHAARERDSRSSRGGKQILPDGAFLSAHRFKPHNPITLLLPQRVSLLHTYNNTTTPKQNLRSTPQHSTAQHSPAAQHYVVSSTQEADAPASPFQADGSGEHHRPEGGE